MCSVEKSFITAYSKKEPEVLSKPQDQVYLVQVQ